MKARTKAKILLITTVIIALLAVGLLLKKIFSSEKTYSETIDMPEHTVAEKPKEYLYGFDLDSFTVAREKVKSGQTFSIMLINAGLNNNRAAEVIEAFKTVFNPRQIKAGNSYTVFTRNDSVQTPAYIIYEENNINYYVLKLEGTPTATKMQREVTIKRMEAKGTISSSLYDAFIKNGMSIALAMEMSEIFAWTVDFYKVQKGDAFKVIYYEKYVEDKAVGIERVEAAYFNSYGKPYYAFRFEEDGRYSYFDESGQSVKKLFLKAPLKFSRISSRYNLKRFHPVLKTVKAHLGTDYAAPAGTPIMTVGDGTVIEAGYTAGNGNYVKVKHNSVYTTQYLHMSKFAASMKKGKRVSQGDVIGYVGSTGLATGPHLCFRFWKNGKQVDPHREKPMQTHPVKKENMPAFNAVVAQLKPQLDDI
jgi:murein DD-endopeptidase MepM/ murein hydrolase activator NlpD